jgi:nitroimidazol reductase NimA-like FMN-containing flavoprotein (pyridoxamine 5'-phosphate oxidase superfamily)
MSRAPRVRRTDKLMAEDQTLATLQRGFAGHLATVGDDGHPYCLPLLYVWMDERIYLHNSRAKGHLRANVDHDARVCFEVDERGEVFAYGQFECDSALAYRSVIVFGTIAVVDDIATKQRFCERLMVKYAKPEWGRPKGFFPRLAEITVYAITPQRMSGKETPLPAVAEQWPALDRTKSPNARVT